MRINEFTLTHLQPIRFAQEFFNYRSMEIQNQIPADTALAKLGVGGDPSVRNFWQRARTR